MPPLAVASASLQCTFGTLPVPLAPVGASRVTVGGLPAGAITDMVPVANVPPFGTCSAPTNPAVISAGAIPPPCVPVITGPWAPGAATVLLGGTPALTATSTCSCVWLGLITVASPGQATVSGT